MDTLYSLLKFLHVVAVIAWVGGMFVFTLMLARLARAVSIQELAVISRQNGSYGGIVIPIAVVMTLLAGLWMVFKVGSGWIRSGWLGLGRDHRHGRARCGTDSPRRGGDGPPGGEHRTRRP